MRELVRKEILGIKPYVPGKPIEEVKRELRLKRVIKLASNENALPPSAAVTKRMQKALLSLNRYPDGGCFYLVRAIARRLGVKEKNIIVGNGSDEIIILAIRAFLKKGEEVIIAKPTFLIYEIASRIAGARIKIAPVKDFRYDVKRMAKLITKKTKLIFISNPDNPLGTYITGKEAKFLIKRAPKNAILFFDEAYYEFARDKADYPRTLGLIKQKNIIIARTFSKAYSLAGARVGYGVARKEIIEALNCVREPFNVNSVAQAAALAALEDKKHLKRSLALVKKGKAYLYRELEMMGFPYVPSATNFILIKAGKNANAIYRKLLRRGIITREMSGWGMNNFIRVTIGTMPENRAFVKALEEII